MSRSKKDEEEYKPSRAKVSKRKSDQFKQAQQQVSLKDLLDSKLLEVGQRLYVKDQEGEVTKDGLIRVFIGDGQFTEYRNPTSWTKVATGRESGGWQQIRMKPNNEVLSTIKDKYLNNLMDGMYDDDKSDGSPEEPIAEEATLPLNVRFACDDTRPFQITWVSPDYKEFHFEYNNKTYTSLADFGHKIYDDMQNSQPPTNTNFNFNNLLYEVEGNWLSTEKLMEWTENNNNSNSRNSSKSNKRSRTDTPPESPQSNSSSTSSTPTSKSVQPEASIFKILLLVDGDESAPIRVDATAQTILELHTQLAEESGLGLKDVSEYEFLLWDDEFKTYTRFPKSLASVPSKCKVSVKKAAKSVSPVPNNKMSEQVTAEANTTTPGDIEMLDAPAVNKDVQNTTQNSTTEENTAVGEETK